MSAGPPRTRRVESALALARDPHLLAALAAGPLCWAALIVVNLPLGSGVDGWALIHGVLLMPLLEEFVFRSGLQGWLLERRALARRLPSARLGISGANLIASIVFAAAHLWTQPPLWAALIFLPSLVFGHLYERRQSIAGPVLVHAFYNAGFLMLFSGVPR